jgi:hypothetical protein
MNRDQKVYLLSTMAQYPAAYAAELRGLPARALTWKPSQREWSLTEVIAHLADTEEIYLNERLFRVVNEHHPELAGFDQAQYAIDRRYNEQDAAASLARFAAANAAVVALAWLVPDEAWDRQGIHNEAGPLTFRDLLLNLARHHASHLNQMRRVKTQHAGAGESWS